MDTFWTVMEQLSDVFRINLWHAWPAGWCPFTLSKSQNC